MWIYFDDIRFIYKTARDAVIKPHEDDININKPTKPIND